VGKKDQKQQRLKRNRENLWKQDFTGNTMAPNLYLSIITLNVNGLNAPIKRHGISEWIQKIRPIDMLSTRDSFWTLRHLQTESEGMENHWTPKES